MSFIYEDPNLIDQLIASGLDFEIKFSKRGQAAANAVQQDRTNLLALIKNLQNQLNPAEANKDPNAGPEISHEGEASAKPQLTSTNLENLGALVSWLVQSKITLDGKRVAYDIREDPKSQDYQLFQLEPGTNSLMPESGDRGQITAGFFVNPDLLNRFIVSLQAYNTSNPNPVMDLQVRKLVQEANTQLGSKITERYQAPEKVLRDTELLDNVPDQFVSKESSGYGGDIPLTYGDLKDEMAFNKWLRDHAISFRINNVPVSFGNPQFNQHRCDILDILSYRASNKAGTDATSREVADIYLRQVSKIMAQLGCARGGEKPTGSADMQGGQQQQQGQGGKQQLSPAQRDLTNEIMEGLPLSLQNIDFNRINEFFGMIAQLMSNNPTVMSYINNTKELMQKTSELTKNHDTVFQLGISPVAVVNMLVDNRDNKQPSQWFFNFVQFLDQIVDNVRAVVGYFTNQLPEDRRTAELYGQIGRRPSDNSIYSSNIRYLTKWMETSYK